MGQRWHPYFRSSVGLPLLLAVLAFAGLLRLPPVRPLLRLETMEAAGLDRAYSACKRLLSNSRLLTRRPAAWRDGGVAGAGRTNAAAYDGWLLFLYSLGIMAAHPGAPRSSPVAS
jgi:hypothetical protein